MTTVISGKLLSSVQGRDEGRVYGSRGCFFHGKKRPDFSAPNEKSISGERFFVRLRLIFRSQPGDFRGSSTARNRFYRIVGGWAWHALFFL